MSEIQITTITPEDVSEFGFIESKSTLEPGCFWRVKNDFETIGQLVSMEFRRGGNKWKAGDIHLLTELCLFDGRLQSLNVLGHPKYGGLPTFNVPVEIFLNNFEPATDAEAQLQRDDFVSGAMLKVQGIQSDMATCAENPLSLEDVRIAAEEAVKKFEADALMEAVTTEKKSSERESDIRRIHRRAARRSEENGNPIALKNVVVSDSVSDLVAGGVTADGVRDLSIESGRRIAIATAASKWLTDRSKEIEATLKLLVPVYEEKSCVALAKSKQAIDYVTELSKGIASLKLYTGEGVTVVTVREGQEAPQSEPLCLLQAKRFMDEELAVHVDVADSFDWSSQSDFFSRLKTDDDLMNQVLPFSRCVCTMAVTRRRIDYGSNIGWHQSILNMIENKAVFLLVRNGSNVYAVYSAEPSHEISESLFPTKMEMGAPFAGVDGQKIGLQDVAFHKSAKEFDAISLAYKRFLILLAGLDHRESLFGSFYPREKAKKFMSLEFQSSYFRFIADEDGDSMIEGIQAAPVVDWMSKMNKSIRSGSRIVISNIRLRSQLYIKQLEIAQSSNPLFHIIKGDKSGHFIEVAALKYGKEIAAKLYLSEKDGWPIHDWFLCIDRVNIEDVNAYLNSRNQRIANIGWIRTMKNAQKAICADLEHEKELRDYLSATAIETCVLEASDVKNAMNEAIATWRASNKGAPAPEVGNITAVNEILTLMFPRSKLVVSTNQMVKSLIEKKNLKPLKLTRTGSSRWALYVECSGDDKQGFCTGVYWGWVKRISLDSRGEKFIPRSSSFVWLQKNVVDATEEVVTTWPDLDNWLNDYDQPFPALRLKEIKQELEFTDSLCGMLTAGRLNKPEYPTKINSDLMSEIVRSMRKLSFKKYYQSSLISLLLGVYQESKSSKPTFIYAITSAAPFVSWYGTAEDIAAARSVCHSSRAGRGEFDMAVSWGIGCAETPLKTHACSLYELPLQIPSWAAINTHERGGVKKKLRSSNYSITIKPDGRQKKNKPLHDPVKVNLSFGRAFDTLMGVAPRPRKEFYREQKRNSRFAIFNGGPNEKSNVKFTPRKPDFYHFADGMWSEEKNRSFAGNILFRTPSIIKA